MTQQLQTPINDDTTATIRRLNDHLRITGEGGRTLLSTGVAGLPADQLRAALEAIATFTAFDLRNDPHGEHDCAVLDTPNGQVLWKIDYYDLSLIGHSPDPADPNLTCRVLTIMLPGEY